MPKIKNWSKSGQMSWKNDNVSKTVKVVSASGTGSKGYRAKLYSGGGRAKIIGRGMNKEDVKQDAIDWMRNHPYE